jgi:threonine/homoserine/homoserine lactone efflux protein
LVEWGIKLTLTLPSLLAFAFAMFILAATPGPGFLAFTARTISNGASAGIGVVAGVVIGDLIYFTLALAGMAAISEAVGSALVLFKIAGGLYLIWLGIKMWSSTPVQELPGQVFVQRSFIQYLIEGVLVTLSNPKAIVFFAAILPTFIYLPDITLVDALVLIATIVLVGAGTDLGYVYLFARARKGLRG